MPYDIEVKELPDQPIVSIRTESTPGGLASTFSQLAPEITAYLAKNDVEPAGPMFAIYHGYGDTVDMEVAFSVPKVLGGEGRIGSRELEAGTAAVTWHTGPYTSIGDAYRAVEAWIRDNGREIAGPPWEVYWTGPMHEQDSSQWRTEVGYPIR